MHRSTSSAPGNPDRFLQHLVVAILMAGCLLPSKTLAADITLRTDHPQYPGEGAFQTVEDCVRFATHGRTDPQEKAIAMYNWFLTHQWHLMSPMEWNVPGRIPDTSSAGDYETVVFDANRARFSYGYGLCGTVHAWNEPYWKAMGFQARRREFPGHVNSEIYYDHSWHAFDTDMAGLLFRPDGIVAGYDDIQDNPQLANSTSAPLPHYPFAWPSDFNAMRDGWKQVAARDHWYSMYNGGYAAHPGIVQLRPGETFTRWYDRDHYGGETKRRFWQNQMGGPQRNWTFFDNGTPRHDAASSNSRGNATYCNGEFDYKPNLTSSVCRQGMWHHSDNTSHQVISPSLYSLDGKPASVTFRHFSPYVICGDPVDNANPMSAPATDGFIISGRAVGPIDCEISANEGQTWTRVPLAPNRHFRVDLTESVKGRYGWQIRFSWKDSGGLDEVRFLTTTQVCQSMYPRLTPGGCQINVKQQSNGVAAVLPDFSLTENQLQSVEVRSLRSENLSYQTRSAQQRFAYRATDNKPAYVVFRVSAPAQLTRINAAFRYQVPIPPPNGCDYQLQSSIDNGQTWTTFATAEIPRDNEFSSGWLAGSFDLQNAGVNEALVRFKMHAPGRRAAMIDAQLYGIYRTPLQPKVLVEYGWHEDGITKQHAVRVAADPTGTTIRVPTGKMIEDQFVRIQAVD